MLLVVHHQPCAAMKQLDIMAFLVSLPKKPEAGAAASRTATPSARGSGPAAASCLCSEVKQPPLRLPLSGPSMARL